MKLSDLLPASGLPASGKPASCDEYWCGLDNLDEYRKCGGHPLYSERDIVYRYNSLGYRCPEFDQQADIRIVSVGCSHTVGVGLPQTAVFHERFAERLRRESGKTVVNWNLGLSGTSCDYVARMLHLAVPRLNPDIVLILFPQLSRREYVSIQGRRMSYNPNYVATDAVTREICSHFAALSSVYDDRLNFYRNYKSIESLLTDHCWFFSLTNGDDATGIIDYVDPARYIEASRRIDRARDRSHPGPETNQAIYDAFWTRFVATGGLDLFAQQGL
jgi:hypothetical protein